MDNLDNTVILKPNMFNNLGIEIIDDFLPQDEFEQIYKALLGPEFPWYLNNKKVKLQDEFGLWEKDKEKINFYNWQFSHVFYHEHTPRSNFLSHISLLLDKIETISWIKIRGTFNVTTTENILLGGYHTDLDENIHALPITTSIFYLGANNGPTSFLGGYKVESVANRLVSFPLHLKHAAISCTDTPYRIQLNLNYITPVDKPKKKRKTKVKKKKNT